MIDFEFQPNSNASYLRELTGAGAAVVTMPVKAEPDLVGPHGKAWISHHEIGAREAGISPDNDATVASWVIEAPWAHPIWHSYQLICVHLRPMPDGRPTKMYREDATHELWLYALSQDLPRDELIATGKIAKGQWLTPCQYAGQFIEESDDTARDRIRNTVQEIIHGTLSPDVDFQIEWRRRFGSHMIKEMFR